MNNWIISNKKFRRSNSTHDFCCWFFSNQSNLLCLCSKSISSLREWIFVPNHNWLVCWCPIIKNWFFWIKHFMQISFDYFYIFLVSFNKKFSQKKYLALKNNNTHASLSSSRRESNLQLHEKIKFHLKMEIQLSREEVEFSRLCGKRRFVKKLKKKIHHKNGEDLRRFGNSEIWNFHNNL